MQIPLLNKPLPEAQAVFIVFGRSPLYAFQQRHSKFDLFLFGVIGNVGIYPIVCKIFGPEHLRNFFPQFGPQLAAFPVLIKQHRAG